MVGMREAMRALDEDTKAAIRDYVEGGGTKNDVRLALEKLDLIPRDEPAAFNKSWHAVINNNDWSTPGDLT